MTDFVFVATILLYLCPVCGAEKKKNIDHNKGGQPNNLLHPKHVEIIICAHRIYEIYMRGDVPYRI